MTKDNITTECLKSAFVDTTDFCLMANTNDFIEVTEWHDKLGYTIREGKQNTSGDFMITYNSYSIGEFKAIKELIKKLK